MKIYHKIQEIEGINQLVMYVEYPADYEFSLDFDSIKNNVANVCDKIRSYALKNIGRVSDNTVLLILNGVVVGTMMVSQLVSPTVEAKDSKSDTELVSQVDQESELQKKTEELLEEQFYIDNRDVKSLGENESIHPPVVRETSLNTASLPDQSPVKTPSVISSSRQISVKLQSGKVVQMGLEDYVYGVVAAEIPVEFHVEALKAQAIAARTYALKRADAGTVLVASSADQNYKSEEELKRTWGKSHAKYSQKVREAVQATTGKYITYQGKYIDALYFSISNGKTEDPIYVWGNPVPYLKSVSSSFDSSLKNYKYTTKISLSQASAKLNVSIQSDTSIQVKERTVGNRIKAIQIGNKVFSGVQIREKLGLRSSDFDIKIVGSEWEITTRGFGHGVGMSQYGANEMAKQGNSYQKILTHYYTGVSIVK